MLGGVLIGQRSHRLQKAEHNRHRHYQVDQHLQNQDPVSQPLPFRAREEHKRQKAVEDDDNEDQANRRLQNLVDAPALVAENQEARQESNQRHGQLRKHCHGQGSAGAGHPQFRFNFLFEDVDVVLKFAGEKFTNFLVDSMDVRNQRQQSQQ